MNTVIQMAIIASVGAMIYGIIASSLALRALFSRRDALYMEKHKVFLTQRNRVETVIAGENTKSLWEKAQLGIRTAR